MAYIATIDPPKDKFGLVAHVDPAKDSVALFLIHSELPKFIQSQPELIKGITKIEAADGHEFLKYDSWVRFGDVHSCGYAELVYEVRRNPARFCGYASAGLGARLLKSIPQCPEISPRWQQRYCDALASSGYAAAQI